MQYDLTHENDRSLKNWPAPCDVSAFQAELNKAGYIGDRPKYHLVWGQTERTWARGCPRIKYATPFVLEEKLWEWGVAEEVPFSDDGESESVTEIIIRSSNRQECEALQKDGKGELTYRRVSQHTVEWVGRPRWVIEVLVEVQESPESWETNRYEYHNEKPERWVPCDFNGDTKQWREDVNGPYQTHRYQYFMDVFEPNGTALGIYKAPDAATLEEFWRMVHAPALDLDLQPQNAYKRAMRVAEEEEAELKASLDEFVMDHKYQYLPDAYKRVALYDPPVMNKVTKHGKAVK